MRLVFSPPARRDIESGTRHIIPTQERAQDRFLSELAQHTDGIGGVHLLHCLGQHGIWAFLQEQGSNGATLLGLSRRFGARLAYLNVVFRVFSAQGWVEWRIPSVERRTLARCRYFRRGTRPPPAPSSVAGPPRWAMPSTRIALRPSDSFSRPSVEPTSRPESSFTRSRR